MLDDMLTHSGARAAFARDALFSYFFFFLSSYARRDKLSCALQISRATLTPTLNTPQAKLSPHAARYFAADDGIFDAARAALYAPRAIAARLRLLIANQMRKAARALVPFRPSRRYSRYVTLLYFMALHLIN